MNNRKNTTLALLIFLGFAFIGYLMWSTVSSRIEENNATAGTVCTMDAVQCADGSWVGRSGPNCEFVCPAGTSTSPTENEVSLQGGIGEQLRGLGVEIIPIRVIEDSRCPLGVQCVQAGTVRIAATVVSGTGTSSATLSLHQLFTTETETIILIAVNPAPEAGRTIAAKDYRFTFKVVKR